MLAKTANKLLSLTSRNKQEEKKKKQNGKTIFKSSKSSEEPKCTNSETENSGSKFPSEANYFSLSLPPGASMSIYQESSPEDTPLDLATLSVEESSLLSLTIIKAAVAIHESNRNSSVSKRRSSDSVVGGKRGSFRDSGMNSTSEQNNGSMRISMEEVNQPLDSQDENLVQVLSYILKVENPENDLTISYLVENECFSLLGELIQLNLQKPIVLKSLLSVVSRLASTEKYSASAIEGHLIEDIVSALDWIIAAGLLTSYDGFENVLCDLILLIGNMAFDSVARVSIRQSGGIDAIILTMNSCKELTNILDPCCYAIANLSVNNTANMECIFELGGIKILCDILRNHSDVRDLTESAICALNNLCALGNQGRVKIADSGVLKLLANLLLSLRDSGLILNILRAIANLALCSRNSSVMIREDTILSISDTMESYKSSIEIIELCCQIISSTTSHCNIEEMSIIVKRNVLDVLINACMLHTDSSKLTLSFLQCLSQICTRFADKLEIPIITMQSFVIPAIANILQNPSQQKNRILKQVLILLVKLSLNEKFVSLAIEGKVMQFVFELLKKHRREKKDSIVTLSLSCFCGFAHKDSADYLIQIKVCDIVASVLSENIRDVKLVDICIRTLTRLSFSDKGSSEIAKIALKPICTAIQYHLSYNDSDFHLMVATLFSNLISDPSSLIYMKSLVGTVIIHLLKIDRDPPMTSQAAMHFVNVLNHLIESDDSGVVLLRLKQADALHVIKNLKAAYDKQFHADLENNIQHLFTILQDESFTSGPIINSKRSSVLEVKSQASIALREASKISSSDELNSSRRVKILRKSSKGSIDLRIVSAKVAAVANSHSSSNKSLRETLSHGVEDLETNNSAMKQDQAGICKTSSPKKSKSKLRRGDRHRRECSDAGVLRSHLNNQSINASSSKISAVSMQTIASSEDCTSRLIKNFDRIAKPSSASIAEMIEESRNTKTEESLHEQWQKLLSKSKDTKIKLSNFPETIQLIRKGVPDSIRASVWKCLSGADDLCAKHCSSYYDMLVDIHSRFGSPYDSEIRKDAPRTLTHLPFFKTEEGREKLIRVLSAYSLRNPESIGYCQSMNFICGTLLTIMNSEEEAFWVLCCMIESRIGYYCKSMCGLLVDQRVLDDLLSFEQPASYDFLAQCDVSSIQFSVSWFMCQFVESPLPITQAVRFWDHLFLFGDEILFQVAVKLFEYCASRVSKTNNLEDILTYFLHGCVNDLPNIEELLNSIRIGTMAEKIALLREIHRNRVISESKQLLPSSLSCSQFGFTQAEIQRLWQEFLRPDPWNGLLHISIETPDRLQNALTCSIYSKEASEWRDRGLLSGLIHRLFQVLDTNSSGKVDFSEFLAGAFILSKSSEDEKLDLAFRYFDLKGDSMVDREEMMNVLQILESSYNGKLSAFDNAQSFCELVFDSCKLSYQPTLELSVSSTEKTDCKNRQARMDKMKKLVVRPSRELCQLPYEEFCHFAMMHPLVCKFFRLDPDGMELSEEKINMDFNFPESTLNN